MTLDLLKVAEKGAALSAVEHDANFGAIEAELNALAQSAFQNASGSQALAPTGRSWKATGNLTALPTANGWWAKFVNLSGSPVSITPASGTCRRLIDGTTAASVVLADGRECIAHADGTNLLVSGDVT